ncbi:MAG: FKBP-type peptidyl-prolyl cis-trans isomerase [Alistipes sp.]|nr:FKBP-type peptidyl-prolyl cis-trans isomerase [Alistipes sp.]
MRRYAIASALAAALVAGGCSGRGGGKAKMASDTDSVAYILGMNMGITLQRMDSTLNVEAVCAGMRDAFGGKTQLTIDQAKAYYLRYMNHTLPERARAHEEEFLAEVARTNRSYARTASGVTYRVAEVGDQELLPERNTDSVVLRWVIRTADGTVRYSSYERGDTLRTTLGDLLPGVRESVKLIGKGGRIEAWLPAAQAYGAEGDAKLGIGPNATLRCEIELLGVDRNTARRRVDMLR